MAGQPNIHKKMDKILQKLATLEANDKGLAKQTNYLAQLVVLAKQDSARQHQESQTILQESQAMLRDMGQMLLEVRKSSVQTESMVHDVGQMLLEVRKISSRTEERVAEILAETRRH